MCGKLTGRIVVAATAGVIAAGCQSPLSSDESADATLRESVRIAVDRELASIDTDDQRLVTTQPPSDVEVTLIERRDELDQIGPMIRLDEPESLGPDLDGNPQQAVALTLRESIRSAVDNNLFIQQARLLPSITEARVVAAEAVFDAILFSNLDYTKTDQPTTVFTGLPIGFGATVSDRTRFETGVRQPLTSGGAVQVSTDFSRFNEDSPGIGFTPDPAYQAAIRLGVTQPLLRGFGSDVNTAAIRLARNTERAAIEQLRSELLFTVEQAEAQYWNLVFAWHDVAISEWLVEVGIQVRDVLELRREFDTRLAQYSDAVATVEQRKADVIRRRRALREASDALKQTINDPEVTIGSEVMLSPIDEMIDAPIAYSLRDAMMTAIANRPEVQQAILAIDDASIRQLVADNGRLPMLDLAAETAFLGLDGDFDGSYDNATDGDFIDYFVGLVFEVPIGNRGPEAVYREARLQRSAAVIGYRQTIQSTIRDVKAALRDVITNYELIQATRSNRIAQAENLRALLVEEETLAALTPEFLNLKFQRQDRLALSRREELEALVNFDTAVASLYRAMGIGLEMNGIELEIDGDWDAEAMPDETGPDDDEDR